MKTYLMRATTLSGHKIWIVATKGKKLHGHPRESRRAVLKRWVECGGSVEEVTRFSGVMRSSEAAMTLTKVLKGED